MDNPVDPNQVLAGIDEPRQPRTVAEVNDYDVWSG
jgi:hypothetical protein